LSVIELFYYLIVLVIGKFRNNSVVPIDSQEAYKSKLEEFSNESTIHGVKFIGNSKATKITRCFWLISLILSIFVLSTNIWISYVKWNIQPSIGIRVKSIPSYNMPFPAITICSPVLFSSRKHKSHARLYQHYHKTGKLLNGTVKEQNFMSVILQRCDIHLADTFLDVLSNRSRTDFGRMLYKTSSNLFAGVDASFIDFCFIGELFISCDTFFEDTLTEKGFCQSFNTLQNTRIYSDAAYIGNVQVKNYSLGWTFDEGYTENSSFIIQAVKKNKVEFSMFIGEKDAQNQCVSETGSFLLYLHLPNEITTPFHQKIRSPFECLKTLKMRVTSYKADDSMKSYSPEKRGCYFKGEKNLKFFKSYTKTLCDYECMTNYTLKHCGCVKFSMPRDNSTPICDIDKVSCYYNIELNWPGTDYDGAPCDCLPPCNDIKYTILQQEIVHVLPKTNSHISIIFEEYVVEEYENYIAYRFQNFICESLETGLVIYLK
jgi:acid-sensing ion channel, other